MKFFQKITNKQKLDYFPKIPNRTLFGHETPLFCTDINIIKNRYQELEKSLNLNWAQKHLIAFSFKTNYEVINEIKKNMDISAEIVSAMEYQMAKDFNFPNSKIIYNGPNKTNITKVIKQKNILVNIDNQSELDKIIKNKNQIKCKIGLRLNTSLKKSRFGFNIENGQATKIIGQLQANQIKINGLHIHLGFYSLPSVYKQISQKIIELIKENNLELEYIDFGGGFPSHGLKPYGFKKYTIPSIDEYINQICFPLKAFFKNQTNLPTIIVEPGRFLVDDSTIFITSTIHSQIVNNCQIVIVDATNQMLSSVWFRPQIIKSLTNQKSEIINTIVYGSSCQEDDILYQGKLPKVSQKNLIIFYCVGAYNQNMTSNFIFRQPKSCLLP